MIFGGNYEPVLANLDLMESDRKKAGKYGDLDFQTGHFFATQRRKAWIAEGGALRAMNNTFAKGFLRFNHANTAAQFSEYFDGDKDSLTEDETSWFGLRSRERLALQSADNCISRQCQHGATLFRGKLIFRKGRHPRT